MIHTRHGRQAIAVRREIMHRGRLEVSDRCSVNQNVGQLNRLRSYFREVNLIFVCASRLRLHHDSRHAGSVRSCDGHLLTRSFVHRDARTAIARQRNYIALQLVFLEARQLNRVVIHEINHLKISVGGGAYNEINHIRLLRPALCRHGYRLRLV